MTFNKTQKKKDTYKTKKDSKKDANKKTKKKKYFVKEMKSLRDFLQESAYDYESEFYNEFTDILDGSEESIESSLISLKNVNIDNEIEVKLGAELKEHIIENYKHMTPEDQRYYLREIIDVIFTHEAKFAPLYILDDGELNLIFDLFRFSKFPLTLEDYTYILTISKKSKIDLDYKLIDSLSDEIFDNPEMVLGLFKVINEINNYSYQMQDEYYYDDEYNLFLQRIPEHLYEDYNFMLELLKYGNKKLIANIDIKYLKIEHIKELSDLDWPIYKLLEHFDPLKLQHAIPKGQVLKFMNKIYFVSKELIINCVLIQNENLQWLSDYELETMDILNIRYQKPISQKERTILEFLFDKNIPITVYQPDLLKLAYEPLYLQDLSGDIFKVDNWFLKDNLYDVIQKQYPDLGEIQLFYNDTLITEDNINMMREKVINSNEDTYAEIFYCEK